MSSIPTRQFMAALYASQSSNRAREAIVFDLDQLCQRVDAFVSFRDSLMNFTDWFYINDFDHSTGPLSQAVDAIEAVFCSDENPLDRREAMAEAIRPFRPLAQRNPMDLVSIWKEGKCKSK